ncbi:MAG: hypothetical protein P8J78_07105 [Maricaulis sp.]|jgi:hypothetical protein|nr:hypothetical protein [Maricaulis sp.]MDG2044361.1 hypothetical protein [Maricaulis sp.]
MRLFAVIAATAAFLTGCQSGTNVFSAQEQNSGVCPAALALYDAHRRVEFNGEEVIYGNIGFTGEILGVRSLCTYSGDRPIIANLEIDMAFGRGPAAIGNEETYEFFVAVTRRDSAILHREVFPMRVRFNDGEDRTYATETIDAISIPRFDEGTSGANFEILVGFELSEEELAFNRSGQRFRVAAGQGQ